MARSPSYNDSNPRAVALTGGPELAWQTLQWPDGAIYEGLVQGGRCHSHGVFQHANADRYEGEFVGNRMQGYGVYVWADGTIYRGEWRESLMHGCGVTLRRDAQGNLQAQEGKFFDDEYVGPIMSCTVPAAQQAATEADVAATLARTFQTEEGQRRRQAAARASRGSKPQPQKPTSAQLQPPSSTMVPLGTDVKLHADQYPQHFHQYQQCAANPRLHFRWPTFRPDLAWPWSATKQQQQQQQQGQNLQTQAPQDQVSQRQPLQNQAPECQAWLHSQPSTSSHPTHTAVNPPKGTQAASGAPGLVPGAVQEQQQPHARHQPAQSHAATAATPSWSHGLSRSDADPGEEGVRMQTRLLSGREREMVEGTLRKVVLGRETASMASSRTGGTGGTAVVGQHVVHGPTQQPGDFAGRRKP